MQYKCLEHNLVWAQKAPIQRKTGSVMMAQCPLCFSDEFVIMVSYNKEVNK